MLCPTRLNIELVMVYQSISLYEKLNSSLGASGGTTAFSGSPGAIGRDQILLRKPQVLLELHIKPCARCKRSFFILQLN